jgi:cytoskeleton protein RodZ
VREVPQGDGDTLSFGAYLKQSRTLRELSLEEVAVATKLAPRLVAALEAEDWAVLQDRTHALFVARSCAAAIGLDPDETALRLEEQLQRSLPPPPRPPLWKRIWAARSREPLVWLVVGVTAIVCAVLLWRR